MTDKMYSETQDEQDEKRYLETETKKHEVPVSGLGTSECSVTMPAGTKKQKKTKKPKKLKKRRIAHFRKRGSKRHRNMAVVFACISLVCFLGAVIVGIIIALSA